MLKLFVANVIELGWQRTRINVLYGKMRGGHCASQTHGHGSCSENIAAAFRGPGTFSEALEAAREQFELCASLAQPPQKCVDVLVAAPQIGFCCDGPPLFSIGGGCCDGPAPAPGDYIFNISHCCRETTPRGF